LKRFVDDIAIELIEAKLISPLYNIFTPITVTSMPTDLVTSIAGESEENRAQREQLNRQLEVLMKGIETCKRFVGVRILGKIVPGLSICEISLIGLVGVDDSTIQSENTSNSANYDSSDSDEASCDLASDDGRSLSDGFHRRAISPIRSPARCPVEEPQPEPEAPEPPAEPPEEFNALFSKIVKTSKKDKKSRGSGMWD